MIDFSVDAIPRPVSFLIRKLEGANHLVYVVGGAVRDICLKRPVTDWDLCTSASVDALLEIFRNESRFSPGHGTMVIVMEGHSYEITTFRGAAKTLASDLSKRDLTINAMALDPSTGEIIDPHHGRRDLQNRILRAVINPEDRFREDPLRLLRTVRLAAQLDFAIHQKTKEAIPALARLLSGVARERIREELMKILMVPKPSKDFNTLITLGLLKEFLPELLEGRLKRQNRYHRFTILKHVLETVDNVKATPVLRLTALLHDVAKPRVRVKEKGTWRFKGHEKASAKLGEKIMKRLKFSKQMIAEVTHLIRSHLIGYNPRWTDAAVRRFIKRVGADHMENLLAFRRADILAHGIQNGNQDILFELDQRIQQQLASSPPIQRSDLAIDGNDIMSVTGLSPGPAVGRILNQLNSIVLEHPQWNQKEKLMEILKTDGVLGL
ncbi:putative tRNA adenylyltransferase [delta proteobacterium NaphS2]|nr:putative tRNA adenylyltransferase [delta proteobacterium NaphS2]